VHQLQQGDAVGRIQFSIFIAKIYPGTQHKFQRKQLERRMLVFEKAASAVKILNKMNLTNTAVVKGVIHYHSK
jgi:hypothetical protein